MMMKAPRAASDNLPVEGAAPSLDRRDAMAQLPAAHRRGAEGQGRARRFLDLFLHQLPAHYPLRARLGREISQDQGLVVIGVHAPEFAFEKYAGNVEKAIADLKIAYPVALDNDYAIWRAFNNQYWPAHYFIDAQGRIRHHHFGEGDVRRVRARHPAAARRSRPQDGARPGQGRGQRRRGRRGRRRRKIARRPISATNAPRTSCRPAARCKTWHTTTRRVSRGSMNGASPATGRSTPSRRPC